MASAEAGQTESKTSGKKVSGFFQKVGEKIKGLFGLGKPESYVTGIHISSITLDKIEIVVDVLVKNNSPFTVPLVDMNYLVESDGRKLLSGKIPDAGKIKGHGKETVKVPVTLVFGDIISIGGDIQPGSVIPYRMKVEIVVDVPLFGKKTIPVEKEGELPIPSIPHVEVEKIGFQKFSFEESVAVLKFKVENTNDFVVEIKTLECQVWLADHTIGGAKVSEGTKMDKKGVSNITTPISFRPKDFGSAMWDIMSGHGVSYTVKGTIYVDTPFGQMEMPVEKKGGTTQLKKKKEDGGEDEADDDGGWFF